MAGRGWRKRHPLPNPGGVGAEPDQFQGRYAAVILDQAKLMTAPVEPAVSVAVSNPIRVHAESRVMN